MRLALVAALFLLTTCSAPSVVPIGSPTSLATPSLAPSMTPTALSIFDMHLHYSREAWIPYPPDKIAEMMNENGIRGALVTTCSRSGPSSG